MNITANNTTHDIENPFSAPTRELVRMLPGPITTHAVISPGPIDLEVGDQVIFEPNEGRNVSLKGKVYLFITEQDVLGVIVPE